MKKSYLFLIVIIISATLFLTVSSFLSVEKLLILIGKQRHFRHQKDEFITLFSDIKDAETDQQNYIITGRKDYLEPYENRLELVKEQVNKIKKDSFSFEQYALVQELSSLIQLKLNTLSELIRTRQTQGLEAAQREAFDNKGRLFTERIRIVMDQLIINQTHLLNQNHQAIQALVRQLFWLNLLTGFIPVILICFLVYFFQRKSLQQEKIKEQFQQSQEIYKAIFGDSKHIIMTTDTRGFLTDFNRGAEKILGYKVKEVMHKMTILEFYDIEDLKHKAQLLSRTIDQQNLFEAFIALNRFSLAAHSEWVMKKKNGHLFFCDQSMVALRDDSHTVQGYLFIASDVSCYKKREQNSRKENAVKAIHHISNIRKPFPWKVLIVDNDPDFRKILTAYLIDLGCQVIAASTGEEALKIVETNSIDLITIDMLMAPLNGYDIVQQLQSNPALKNIPIAFISIVAKEIRGKIPGVVEYVDKPITKESILQLLQKCQSLRNTSSL